jgi:hypothetical protein
MIRFRLVCRKKSAAKVCHGFRDRSPGWLPRGGPRQNSRYRVVAVLSEDRPGGLGVLVLDLQADGGGVRKEVRLGLRAEFVGHLGRDPAAVELRAQHENMIEIGGGGDRRHGQSVTRRDDLARAAVQSGFRRCQCPTYWGPRPRMKRIFCPVARCLSDSLRRGRRARGTHITVEIPGWGDTTIL